MPGMPGPAVAAFYKCVSADGSTTYNDAPCAADESTHRLNKNARNMARLDCRIARNFAFDAVARMRQDDSAMDVFRAYGGVTNLSEDARSLINYVYTFKNNARASVQRIVELTTERCEAGLLGKTLDQCESFPGEFIQRFDNCVAARKTDQTILLMPPSEEASGASGSNNTNVSRFSQTPSTHQHHQHPQHHQHHQHHPHSMRPILLPAVHLSLTVTIPVCRRRDHVTGSEGRLCTTRRNSARISSSTM